MFALKLSKPVLRSISNPNREISASLSLYNHPYSRHTVIYKFRLISVDDDESLTELASTDDGDDPHVTRVGHFIHRYSIDELLEFLNSLAGLLS